jgi:hypothetical protein
MKKISGNAQKAKLTALREANKMARDMMKEDLSGLKKVTIASDSKEGLKAGLEKAEEMMEGGEEEEKDCSECPGCPECEGKEESEDSEEMEDESEMDESDIDAQIAELMKMKEKLKKA